MAVEKILNIKYLEYMPNNVAISIFLKHDLPGNLQSHMILMATVIVSQN